VRSFVALLLIATPLAAEHLLTWDRKDNTFRLNFDNGSTAEIELVSQSTFRVRRGLEGQARKPISDKTVECKATGTPAGLKIETDELNISVARATGFITVQLAAGMRLFSETAARVTEGNSLLDIEVPKLEKFFGLGARPHANMDARGLVLQPSTPFFVTGNGYAFWSTTPAAFEFDMGKTRPDHVRIKGSELERLEYYFAFGPTMKEIWDERQKVMGAVDLPVAADFEVIQGPRLPRHAKALPKSGLSGKDLLCAEANALVHATLSGVLMPAFDLGRYRNAGDAVMRRAARLGVFAPILYDSSNGGVNEATAFRHRLNHFLITYADEARYRGYPMLHPLLHQFPRDLEAGRHIDAFMFGDEFLIVPVCDGAAKRDVYLPMGNWTDWNTNVQHPGRRTTSLDVPADGVIVLVKSGSVVPLNGVQPGDPTELHYFPKNGGEFFLFEPDAADYTQAHAGPAADIYRVEIESKVARRYEWVIHHMERPKAVQQVEGAAYEETQATGPIAAGKWRYDAANRSLHIGVAATAFSDIIVNIAF
jgi:alpha-glucosidase (family GH31 glycosyl hydrolase)